MNGKLPKTGDAKYDKFLMNTLGKCLPMVVIHVCEVRPSDPISCIAENLHIEAKVLKLTRSHDIKYQEYLKTSYKEEIKIKHRRRLDMKRYEGMKFHYQGEYFKNRMQEERINKWLLKDEFSTFSMSDAERRRLEKRIAGSQLENKEERKQFMEKKRVWEQSILNPKNFKNFVLRTLEVHKKEALAASRLRSSTRKAPSETVVLDNISSKRTSTVRRSTRHTPHFSDGSSSSSSVGSLPTLASSKTERLGDGELKYERMQAKRELCAALSRGDFEQTEDGVKVFVPKNWSKIGLKPESIPPRDQAGKSPRCNLVSRIPTTWDDFDCKVFYEPELYVRCDTENDSLLGPNRSELPRVESQRSRKSRFATPRSRPSPQISKSRQDPKSRSRQDLKSRSRQDSKSRSGQDSKSRSRQDSKSKSDTKSRRDSDILEGSIDSDSNISLLPTPNLSNTDLLSVSSSLHSVDSQRSLKKKWSK